MRYAGTNEIGEIVW